MSLRTDPASGTTYGPAYTSEPFERPVDHCPVTLEVYYSVGGAGPQVTISCAWGLKMAGRGVNGPAVTIPREQWDRMLAELRP